VDWIYLAQERYRLLDLVKLRVPQRDVNFFINRATTDASMSRDIWDFHGGDDSSRVVWIVTPCGVVVAHQRFGGPCCLHLQGEDGGSMDNTRRHKPEDLNSGSM